MHGPFAWTRAIEIAQPTLEPASVRSRKRMTEFHLPPW